MPIVFEEVTGEIASPNQSGAPQSDQTSQRRQQESALEREATLRRQLVLLAERERRCLVD